MTIAWLPARTTAIDALLAERAPGDDVDLHAGPARAAADAAEAAPAHDARREPHQADDDPERDDQASEQRECRRR